jgi:predicted AlkP superfamily phosphohydrolase/phosphomutase
MTRPPPIVLLGFDATEIDLIDRLVEEGRMPNLAALRLRGRWGRIQTQPPNFLSLVWSTFYTSMRLGQHGWYFNKLWNCDRQQIEYVTSQWLPMRPFWESLDDRYRVCLLDIPFAAIEPKGANQVMLNGWQCHDDFGRKQSPRGEWDRIRRSHGHPRMTPEVFGPQTASTLLEMRREVLETNRQFADITCSYLGRERWDLLVAVFGSVHRGTHYLWDLSQIESNGLPEKTSALLRGARDECYESFDSELGRIVDAAPPDARIVAFALHGMGANDGWYEYLPRLVEQIHRGGGAAPTPKKGLLYRVKKALPWTLVRQITRRIPHAWNQALVPLWSRRMFDWSKTKYFTLPMDYNGYVRLNLKGREKNGCVDPADVDRVIAQLEEGLRSFRDIESGRPVIRGVVKVDDIVGANEPRRRVLPDLIILWDPPHPAGMSSGVISPMYGEVRWPKGRKLDSGRSGNHTPNGWFAAAGPGIEPGRSSRVFDSADLIPTVFEWLGAARPDHFAGRPIEDLLGRAGEPIASR